MKNRLRQYWAESPRLIKATGTTLIIVGLLSIITPFTPVGFLLILGLEMLGIRALFWNKLKNWVDKVASSKNRDSGVLSSSRYQGKRDKISQTHSRKKLVR